MKLHGGDTTGLGLKAQQNELAKNGGRTVTEGKRQRMLVLTVWAGR